MSKALQEEIQKKKDKKNEINQAQNLNLNNNLKPIKNKNLNKNKFAGSKRNMGQFI